MSNSNMNFVTTRRILPVTKIMVVALRIKVFHKQILYLATIVDII